MNARVLLPVFLGATVLGLIAAGCSGGAPSGAGAPAALSYRPHRSQAELPFANGFAAAVYDAGRSAHRLVAFRDHIYARKDASTPSRNFLNEAYFGFRKAGMSGWLTAVPAQEEGYLPGTGIVRTLQRVNGIAYECFYFTPMSVTAGAEQALVAIVHATNEGAETTDCGLFAYLDLHLGGDADATGEWVWSYAPGAFMEGKAGTGNRVAAKALGPVAHFCAGNTPANDPVALVLAGRSLTDANDGATPADDVRCAFEADIAARGPFASGAEAWFGVALAYRGDVADAAGERALQASLDALAGAGGPEALLRREVDYWDHFHKGEVIPPGAMPDEVAVIRQSLAVIKMAQCREAAPAAGQIVASLPPGQWNIAWVRDACYAIRALVETGHFAEARAGLEFFLNARAGLFQAEIGRPYAISVARYFGGGVEESDDDGQGPNIELDDFGLFLGALGVYVEKSGDVALATLAWPEVRDGVADVLVSLIDANDVLRADSSIWERHLATRAGTPDGKKQFAYSSIQAVAGLRAAAALGRLAGEPAKAAEYEAAAARIAGGIAREVTLGDVLCASVEDRAAGLAGALDGAVVEAVNLGVVGAKSAVAAATLAALEGLRTFALLSPGYLRTDDAKSYGPDNWYDRQEWVFIDLRVASALAAMGRKPEARVLLEWVTGQTRANFDLIAELYDEGSADYRGAVPMVGFGAGAYILAIFDYERS
jgi:GH15 family glucan-1,4-alpha-glucosidase